MNYSPNFLSKLGRSSIGFQFVVLPSLLFLGVKFGTIYMENSKAKLLKEMKKTETMKKAVDPDLFNPFTPIPYHNSKELFYLYDKINMRNYVNENHINVEDYEWKNYNYSYDHNDEKIHTFNWSCKKLAHHH